MTYFMIGKGIGLRRLEKTDINETYLSWLNDPVVNQYSGRRKFPSSFQDIEGYFASLPRDTYVLAICLVEGNKHVGNIKFGPIDWPNSCCEIEILIGDKCEWGKGYGTEAIALVTQHLFQNLNLNRVESKSANPAFAKMVVEKLGWTKEGEMRKRFFLDGKFVNYSLFSILKEDFHQQVDFKAPQGKKVF